MRVGLCTFIIFLLNSKEQVRAIKTNLVHGAGFSLHPRPGTWFCEVLRENCCASGTVDVQYVFE